MVGGVKVGGLEEGGYSTLICLHLPVWCAAGSIQHLPQPQPQTLNGTSCLSPAPLHCFQAYVWYLADAGIFIVSLFYFFYFFFVSGDEKQKEQVWQWRKGGLKSKHLPWCTCFPRAEAMRWAEHEGSFLKLSGLFWIYYGGRFQTCQGQTFHHVKGTVALLFCHLSRTCSPCSW